MENIVNGAHFMQWLIEQGIIADGPLQRVVIDAWYNQPVMIYTQAFGTEALSKTEAPQSLRVALQLELVQEMEDEG